ncbi:5-formyltetrahydrofolate cyclo-ligase [Chitinophaga sancti]|uniref:5-formyltetrahydrofolate cyclo-ligase n=1 Tax=Chitinophaga sancti TaxID=1004 RepID=A0A1K1SBX3_9BACT|nr:5-formyltetrahydrofolate cyclo-ligase [Chitinophaga sancti]WQD63525.1 5-formyltetrahydrofolate cyclo-ligase [Chitinophaga sancti]WQG90849.1 5-formyltetrahydrofolate cyclo-ligase [Chitinophaga sancti]SFW81549.1 5-formyltetrahydrofolate cyclo-ligase [Chitinophaga sancti]
MLTKKDIRREFLEKRLNTPPELITTLNAQLLAQCRLLDFSPYKLAHIFLPIREKKEVDTQALVDQTRTTFPALQWVISRSNMSDSTMLHYLWEQNTVLEKNAYGIPEPTAGTLIAPADLDLVFVPLLAFDTDGHRVGYGKGMYDRFLEQCRPDVTTIGLSLFDPVAGIADIGSWDVPLSIVVTPHTIYHFTKS